MKHQNKKGRKLGRVKKVRTALIKSLVVALVERGKITTTEAKAKELKTRVEPLVTKARNKTVATRRYLAAKLPAKTVKKLVDEIAPRYKERAGGYTRVTHLGARKRDASPMAIIEFV